MASSCRGALLLALVGGTLGLRSDVDVVLDLHSEGDGEALIEVSAQSGRWAATGGRIPVWLWWDYTDAPGMRPPGYVVACQAALETFARPTDFEVHHVNFTNVKTWLADWPSELSRVYAQAVSDAVRAGLLAKYGGVYMDSDVLLNAPLHEMTDHLDTHDMVTYEALGQDVELGSFSSNFMAARPGNMLHTAWWTEIKAQLKAVCPAGEDASHAMGVCCYSSENGALLPDCHVTWGGLGERTGHRIFKGLHKGSFKTKAFREADNQGFAPCTRCMFSLYHEDSHEGPKLVDERCKAVDMVDLHCNKSGLLQNFFRRKAFHLFSSLQDAGVRAQSFKNLTDGPYVISRILKDIVASSSQQSAQSSHNSQRTPSQHSDESQHTKAPGDHAKAHGDLRRDRLVTARSKGGFERGSLELESAVSMLLIALGLLLLGAWHSWSTSSHSQCSQSLAEPSQAPWAERRA